MINTGASMKVQGVASSRIEQVTGDFKAHAQSTFGCIVCHFVAFSNASATRSGEASSYKPPVNMIARGRLGVPVKPHGTQTVGWPVILVMMRLALPGAGATKTSHCDMNLSIS